MNAKLLSFANQNAHDLVPKVRRLIAQPSFTAGLETFGGQLSGQELVHTAYFEQNEIIKLIVANMSWDRDAEQSTVLRSMPPWLRKWFVACKHGVDHRQPTRTERDAHERSDFERREAG